MSIEESAVGAGRAALRPADEGDLAGIEAVMEASLKTDSIPGFSRFDLSRAIVRIPADYPGTIVALDGETVVGYCTPRHDDLTVHPAWRRLGHGRALVLAALELTRARREAALVLYVPKHLDASHRFATSLGFRYQSSLWLFELAGDVALAGPEFPAGVRTRTWSDAEELDAYVEFANASFDGHPTPLGLSVDLVRHVANLPGFDPQGILIVMAQDSDRPVAFAKVELMAHADAPVSGYVAQIGVLPAWRGHGLGRALLRWGVGYLRARGALRIELSVEARNSTATRLYRSEGFEPKVEWPHWALPT